MFTAQSLFAGESITTNLAIKTGGSVGHSSADFFDLYFKEINRTRIYKPEGRLGPAFIFSAIARYNYTELIKFGIGVEKFNLRFNETFIDDFDNSGGFTREIIEDLKINETVLNLIFEYRPYPKLQFRSYFGTGLLVSIFDTKWTELVNSPKINDIRSGGIIYHETTYRPGFTLYTGVELDFDKYYVKNMFKGIFLEVKMNYNPKYDDYFKNYQDQFIGKDEVFVKEVGLNNLYLIFSFGLNLDLYHIKSD